MLKDNLNKDLYEKYIDLKSMQETPWKKLVNDIHIFLRYKTDQQNKLIELFRCYKNKIFSIWTNLPRICVLPPCSPDEDPWSPHHYPTSGDNLPHLGQLCQPRHYQCCKVRRMNYTPWGLVTVISRIVL